jgi:hypothetical protein
VGVEQRPHAPRELRRRLFDVLPSRHAPMIAPMTDGAGYADKAATGVRPVGGRRVWLKVRLAY